MSDKQPNIEQYESMGFDLPLILQAWEDCKGNDANMLETLLKLKYSFMVLYNIYQVLKIRR